jgi:uncharacterized protein YneF (UPF0154 family)
MEKLIIFIYLYLAFVFGFILGSNTARRAFEYRLDSIFKNSFPADSKGEQ